MTELRKLFWDYALKRTSSLDELLPWLYLKGISTGDFQEALQSLLGSQAENLSPGIISRLKTRWIEEYKQWNQRRLENKHYVYVWTDGEDGVRVGNDSDQEAA